MQLGVIDADLDDREAARLWAESGAAWLTDPSVPTPGRLVRRVIGLVESLDRQGAQLAEMLPARGLGILAERSATMGLPRSGRRSAGGASHLLRCADGWLALSLARLEDRSLLPAWLCEEFSFDGRDDDELWISLESAIEHRRVDDLARQGAVLGLPCSKVEEVTSGDHVITTPLARAGTGRPLDGAMVVSLASLWAGPLCADILARLGARVITVESTGRPDGGRRARRFFETLHGRSESVALDLSSAGGRSSLHRLIASADVVIEGSRPRALEQMGIHAHEMLLDGPSVWLSITAFGRAGSAGHRVGFGDDAAAGGGLVGWVDDEPRFLADAVADPLTGLTAAVVVADLIGRSGAWLADISLARTAHASVGGNITSSDVPQHPRPRADPGRPMPLGRDTDDVLSGLGIGRP